MPSPRLLLGLLVIGGFAGFALRRRVDVVEVRGRSMAPALEPGDRLIVVRRRSPLRAGDIVLALDPRDAGRELVKRVAEVGPRGVLLRGDDPSHSTDGRVFGWLPESAVAWRVVARYWPPDRIGRVGRPVRLPEPPGSGRMLVTRAL